MSEITPVEYPMSAGILACRDLANWLQQNGHPSLVKLTGSLAIVGAGADIDMLVYSNKTRMRTEELFVSAGWVNCSEEEYGADTERYFIARKGALNVIVCYEHAYYTKWQTAEDVCINVLQSMGSCPKELRKAIFRTICDD